MPHRRLLRQIRTFEQLFETLQRAFPDDELSVRSVQDDDTFVILPPAAVKPAAQILVEQFDCYHLSAITGVDNGEALELLYHFWKQYGITLHTTLPYDAVRIPTLTDFIPGAAFYEREIYEMLGVTFEGLQDTSPLLLPDDWDGGCPLRK